MGIICSCRQLTGCFGKEARVNHDAVEIHIRQNPHLLGQQWDVVSKDMTGCEMNCGRCEGEGNEFLQWIADSEGVAMSPSAIPA